MGAHPESGLTKRQFSALEGQLLEQRQQILARLYTRARQDREADTSSAVLDAMDAAVQEEQRALPRQLADAEAARLAAINHALARIAEDSYGVSEQSGKPIGIARLSAEPSATLTADEVQALEQEYRGSRTLH
jgi:RNA polymerase-binding transcription factor